MKEKIVICLEGRDGEMYQILGQTMLSIQKEYDLNQNHQELPGFFQFATDWLRKDGMTITDRIEKIRWDRSTGIKEYKKLRDDWNDECEYKRRRQKRWLIEINKMNKMNNKKNRRYERLAV